MASNLFLTEAWHEKRLASAAGVAVTAVAVSKSWSSLGLENRKISLSPRVTVDLNPNRPAICGDNMQDIAVHQPVDVIDTAVVSARHFFLSAKR